MTSPETAYAHLRRNKALFWNELFAWVGATITLVIALFILMDVRRENITKAAIRDDIRHIEQGITTALAGGYVKKSHDVPIVQSQQTAARRRDQLLADIQARLGALEGRAGIKLDPDRVIIFAAHEAQAPGSSTAT